MNYKLQLSNVDLPAEKFAGVVLFGAGAVPLLGGGWSYSTDADSIILYARGLSSENLGRLVDGLIAQAAIYGGEIGLAIDEVADV